MNRQKRGEKEKKRETVYKKGRKTRIYLQNKV